MSVRRAACTADLPCRHPHRVTLCTTLSSHWQCDGNVTSHTIVYPRKCAQGMRANAAPLPCLRSHRIALIVHRACMHSVTLHLGECVQGMHARLPFPARVASMQRATEHVHWCASDEHGECISSGCNFSPAQKTAFHTNPPTLTPSHTKA
eukprot:1158675-Pelagomonas_calceolata.AAC.5